MATAEWRFILCESPDPAAPNAPLVKIGELTAARGKRVEIMRNRAGSCSFTIPVWDDLAYEILDKVDLGDVRGSVRKCVRVLRNDVTKWSGPIWTINGSLPEGMLQIGCVGWLEQAEYWELQADANYTTTAQDAIAYDVLSKYNAQDAAHPANLFAGSSHGTMQARTRAYKRGQKVGEIWRELSNVESGFDIDVNPDTRYVDFWSWDSYIDRTNVHLGYKWGPDNIAKLAWVEDASKTVNYLTVNAIGGVPVIAPDPASTDEYGRFEQSISLPETSADIATYYANAEVAIKSRPLVTYTVTPFPVNTDADTPALFDDFDIGDQIYFSAREGAFKVSKQAIRVFGAGISIDEEGNERIDSLSTSPAT